MKTEELIKAKKYIEHVIGIIKHDGHLGRVQTEWILPDLEKALAAIEGDECSSDTDKLSVEKLQEQLNTAKKALTEISSTRQKVWRGGTLVGLEATEDAKIAFDALAAIGVGDE